MRPGKRIFDNRDILRRQILFSTSGTTKSCKGLKLWPSSTGPGNIWTWGWSIRSPSCRRTCSVPLWLPDRLPTVLWLRMKASTVRRTTSGNGSGEDGSLQLRSYSFGLMNSRYWMGSSMAAGFVPLVPWRAM